MRYANNLFFVATLSLSTVGVLAGTANASGTAVKASWYGKQFHGRTMANGERFNMYDPSIVAHKSLPFGTKLRVTNPKNGRSCIVYVKDRGPFIRGRTLDFSKAAADCLGFTSRGTAVVSMEIVHK
jgi:rare lipoprotein A